VSKNTPSPDAKKNYNQRQLLQEERYVWMARAFVLMTVLGILANVVLLVAISGAVPFLRVQPFYLNIRNKEEQLISVERLPAKMLNARDLQENLVRQYITAYFGVEPDESEFRRRTSADGILAQLSDDSVFKNFQKENEKVTRDVEESNLVRDVYIYRTSREPPKNPGSAIWEVYLCVYENSQALNKESIYDVIATLEIGFKPQDQALFRSQWLKNPLGFKVRHIDYKIQSTGAGVNCQPRQRNQKKR